MASKLIEIRNNEKEITKIAENAMRVLKDEHSITISHGAAIPTVAYAFLREAVAYLNNNKTLGGDTEINLFQLMDIGISHRENEDGEKEGNFTPYINPGQEFKLLVKDDGETEE